MQPIIGYPFTRARRPTQKIVRRAFTPEEDAKLVEIVTQHSHLNWQEIAPLLEGRSARQCRERWAEYLKPGIRVEPWTELEDNLLLRQIELHGHRWATIAQAFWQRSDNDVKNRWYSHLRDSVMMRTDGHLELMRDARGNRIHFKQKRRRSPVAASARAFQALGYKKRDEDDDEIVEDVVGRAIPQQKAEETEDLVHG
jgi:hypothetical protein